MSTALLARRVEPTARQARRCSSRSHRISDPYDYITGGAASSGGAVANKLSAEAPDNVSLIDEFGRRGPDANTVNRCVDGVGCAL